MGTLFLQGEAIGGEGSPGYRLRRVFRLESSLPPLPNHGVVTRRGIGLLYPGPGEAVVVDGYGEQVLRVSIESPSAIDVSHTGGYAAIASYTGYLGLYGVSGSPKWTLDLSEQGGIVSLALSPRELRLAVGTATGGVLVYDESGLLEWRAGKGAWFMGSRRPVYSVRWSRGGSLLVVGRGDRLELYSGEGEKLWSLGLGSEPVAVEWSPGDSEIAVATRDRRILVVGPERGEVRAQRRLARKPLSLTWMGGERILVGTGVRARRGLYGSLEVLTRRGLHVWSTCDIAAGPVRTVGPAPPLPIEGDYLALPSPLEEVYVVQEAGEQECLRGGDA